MRKLLLQLTLVLTCAVSNLAFGQDISAMVSKALEDKKLPAMSVLLIEDGKIKSQVTQGLRATNSTELAQEGDPWNIGSCGKAITATLLARLVDRGLLSWDTPLVKLLPKMKMHPSYRDVTLLELLSHRAGMPPNVDEKWIDSLVNDKRSLTGLRLAYTKRALLDKPIGPVRDKSEYSNSGVMIAATIAEHITGKTFESLIEQEVFAPLGMKVGFGATKPGQTMGHKDGKPVTGVLGANPLFMSPTGEYHMSMKDWAAFAIDQLQGERGNGKLLKQATYLKMHTAQGNTDAALGWGVKTNFPPNAPQRIIMHLGSNGFWHTTIVLIPGNQSGALLAVNAAEGTDAQAVQVKMAMEITSIIAAGKNDLTSGK